MRWLAILLVRAYRLTLRRWWRRVCLYDESCSAFAIRTLRERGVRVGVPIIRARVRSCRLPVGACYLLGADGGATLIAATGRGDAPVPPGALAHCEAEARAVHGAAQADGVHRGVHRGGPAGATGAAVAGTEARAS